MLDLNVVYNKTEAGSTEVRLRARGLRTELRRLLILVDGISPVGRFATFVRGAEIALLVLELEDQGLIVASANGDLTSAEDSVTEARKYEFSGKPESRRSSIRAYVQTATAASAGFAPKPTEVASNAENEAAGHLVAPQVVSAARPPVDEARLLIVRASATRTLRRLLGVESHEWVDALQQPGDSLALRAVISEIHQTLEEQFGVQMGQQFLDGVRGATDSGHAIAT